MESKKGFANEVHLSMVHPPLHVGPFGVENLMKKEEDTMQ
jgi:hypothetical protein